MTSASTSPKRQAVVYDPSMKEAYTWWAVQFIDGLRGKFNDRPRDAVPQKTIVVMAECAGTDLPGKDDVVYFEIPEAIGRITSLQAEMHLFVFETLPATPTQGLNEIDRAKRSCWCWTIGLEADRGGVELRADWEIGNRARPVLHRTRSWFRPSPRRGIQQVRVELRNEVYDGVLRECGREFVRTFVRHDREDQRGPCEETPTFCFRRDNTLASTCTSERQSMAGESTS